MNKLVLRGISLLVVFSLLIDPHWVYGMDRFVAPALPSSVQALILSNAFSSREMSDRPFRQSFDGLKHLSARLMRSEVEDLHRRPTLFTVSDWVWKHRAALYVTGVLSVLAVRVAIAWAGGGSVLDHADTGQTQYASVGSLISAGLLLCRRSASKDFQQLTRALDASVELARRTAGSDTLEEASDAVSATEQINVEQLAELRQKLNTYLNAQTPLEGAAKIQPHILFVRPKDGRLFTSGERRSVIHYSADSESIYISIYALEDLLELTEGDASYEAAIRELALHAWKHLSDRTRTDASPWRCNLEGTLEGQLLVPEAADAEAVVPLSRQDRADLEALTQDVALQAHRKPKWLGRRYREFKRRSEGPNQAWMEERMLEVSSFQASRLHRRRPRPPQPKNPSTGFAPGELRDAFGKMGWKLHLTYYPFKKSRNAFNLPIRWGFVWVHEASRTRIQIGRNLVVQYGYLTQDEETKAEADFKAPVHDANFSEPYLLTALSVIRQPRVLRAFLEQPEFDAKTQRRQRLILLGLGRLTLGEQYPSTIPILSQRVSSTGALGGSAQITKRDIELVMEVLHRLAQDGLDLGDRKVIPTALQIVNARAALAQRQMHLGDVRGWWRLAPLYARYFRQMAAFLTRTVSYLRLFGLIQSPWRRIGKPLEDIHDIAAAGDGPLGGAQALLEIEKTLSDRGVDINRFKYSAVDAVLPALKIGEQIVAKAQARKPADQRLQVATEVRNIADGLPWANESQDIIVTGLLGSLGDGAVPVTLGNGEQIHLDRRVYFLTELTRALRQQGYLQLLVRRDLPKDVRKALQRFGLTIITEPNARLLFGSRTLLRLLQKAGRIRIGRAAFDRLRSRFYGSSHVVAVKTADLTDDDLRALAADHALWDTLRGFTDLISIQNTHEKPEPAETKTRRQPEPVNWGRLSFKNVPRTEADPTGIGRVELNALMSPGQPLEHFQEALRALVWGAGAYTQAGPLQRYLTDDEVDQLREFLDLWNDPTELSFPREDIAWIMSRVNLEALRQEPPGGGPTTSPRKPSVDRPLPTPREPGGGPRKLQGPSLLAVFTEETRRNPDLLQQIQWIAPPFVALPEPAPVDTTVDVVIDPPSGVEPAASTVIDILAGAGTGEGEPSDLSDVALRDLELPAPPSAPSAGAPFPATPLTADELDALTDFLAACLRDGNWISARWGTVVATFERRGHPLPDLSREIAALRKASDSGRRKGTRETYDVLYRVIDHLNTNYLRPRRRMLLVREPEDSGAKSTWSVGIATLAKPNSFDPFAQYSDIAFYAVNAPDGFESAVLDTKTRVIDERLHAARTQNMYRALKESAVAEASAALGAARLWLNSAVARLGFRPAMIRRQDRRHQRLGDLIESATLRLSEQAYVTRTPEDAVRKSWDRRTPAYVRWPSLSFVERYLKPNAPIEAISILWKSFAASRWPDHARAQGQRETFVYLNKIANATDPAVEFSRWGLDHAGQARRGQAAQLSPAQRWTLLLMVHALLGPEESLRNVAGTIDEAQSPEWVETRWPAVSAFLISRSGQLQTSARRALVENFTHEFEVDAAGTLELRQTRVDAAAGVPLNFGPADTRPSGPVSVDGPVFGFTPAEALHQALSVGLQGMEAAIAAIKALAPASLADRVNIALLDGFLLKPTTGAIDRRLKDRQLYVPNQLTSTAVLWLFGQLGLGPAAETPETPPLSSALAERFGKTFLLAVDRGEWPEAQWNSMMVDLSTARQPFPTANFQWELEDLRSAALKTDKRDYNRRIFNFVARLNLEYFRTRNYIIDVSGGNDVSPQWRAAVLQVAAQPRARPVVSGLDIPFQIRSVVNAFGAPMTTSVDYVRHADILVDWERAEVNYKELAESTIPRNRQRALGTGRKAEDARDLERWFTAAYGANPDAVNITTVEVPQVIIQQMAAVVANQLGDKAYRDEQDQRVRQEWDRRTPPWSNSAPIAFRDRVVTPSSPLDRALNDLDRSIVGGGGTEWAEHGVAYSAVETFHWLTLFAYTDPAIHFADILSRFYTQSESAPYLYFTHAQILLFLAHKLDPLTPVTMAELMDADQNRAAVRRISDLLYRFHDSPEVIRRAARAVMAENYEVQLAVLGEDDFAVTHKDGTPFHWTPLSNEAETRLPGLRLFFQRAFERGTIDAADWANLRKEFEAAFGPHGLESLDAFVYIHNRVPLSNRQNVINSLFVLVEAFDAYLEPQGIHIEHAQGRQGLHVVAITKTSGDITSISPGLSASTMLKHFFKLLESFSSMDAAVFGIQALLPDSLRSRVDEQLIRQFIRNPNVNATEALLKRNQIYIPSRLTPEMVRATLNQLKLTTPEIRNPMESLMPSGGIGRIPITPVLVRSLADKLLQACVTGVWPDVVIQDLSILGLPVEDILAITADLRQESDRHRYYQKINRLVDRLNSDFFEAAGLRIHLDSQENGAGPSWIASVVQLNPAQNEFRVEGLTRRLRVIDVARSQAEPLAFYEEYLGGLDAAVNPESYEAQSVQFVKKILPMARAIQSRGGSSVRAREILSDFFRWNTLAYGENPTADKITTEDLALSHVRVVIQSLNWVIAQGAYEHASNESVLQNWDAKTPENAHYQTVAYRDTFLKPEGPAAQELNQFQWPPSNDTYTHPDYALGLVVADTFKYLTTLLQAPRPAVQLMDIFSPYLGGMLDAGKFHVPAQHALTLCLLARALDPEHPVSLTELVNPETNWEPMHRISQLLAAQPAEQLEDAARRAIFASYVHSIKIDGDKILRVVRNDGRPVFFSENALNAGHDPKTAVIRRLSDFLRESFERGEADLKHWNRIRGPLEDAFGKNSLSEVDELFKAQPAETLHAHHRYTLLRLIVSGLNSGFLQPNGYLANAVHRSRGWAIEILHVRPLAVWVLPFLGVSEIRVNSSNETADPVLRVGLQTGPVTSWPRLLHRAQDRLARFLSVRASGLGSGLGTVADHWFAQGYGDNPTPNVIARRDEANQRLQGGLLTITQSMGAQYANGLPDEVRGRWNMWRAPDAVSGYIPFAERYLRPGSDAARLYDEAPSGKKAEVAEQLAWLFSLLSTAGQEDWQPAIGEFIARYYDTNREELKDHEKWFMQLLMRRRDFLVDHKDPHAPLNEALTVPQFARGLRDIPREDIASAVVSVIQENFLCWLEMSGDKFTMVEQRPGAPMPFPGWSARQLQNSLRVLLAKKWLTPEDLVTLEDGLADLAPTAEVASLLAMAQFFTSPPVGDDWDRRREIHQFILALNDYLISHYSHFVSYEREGKTRPHRLEILPIFQPLSSVFHVAGEGQDFSVRLLATDGISSTNRHPVHISEEASVTFDLTRAEAYTKRLVQWEKELQGKDPALLTTHDRMALKWLSVARVTERLKAGFSNPLHYVESAYNLIKRIAWNLGQRRFGGLLDIERKPYDLGGWITPYAGSPTAFDEYIRKDGPLWIALSEQPIGMNGLILANINNFSYLNNALRDPEEFLQELAAFLLNYSADANDVDPHFINLLWLLSGQIEGAPKYELRDLMNPQNLRLFIDDMSDRLLALKAADWTRIVRHLIDENFKIRLEFQPNNEIRIVSTDPSSHGSSVPHGPSHHPVRASA
jgi:hypothetical protein